VKVEAWRERSNGGKAARRAQGKIRRSARRGGFHPALLPFPEPGEPDANLVKQAKRHGHGHLGDDLRRREDGAEDERADNDMPAEMRELAVVQDARVSRV